MTIGGKFAKGVAWMAAGGWTEQAINFGVFVTMAKLLGPELFGLLSMAAVFIVPAEALVRESVSEYLIAAHDPTDEDYNATFWLTTGLGLGLAVLLWLIAGPIAYVYGQEIVAGLIRGLSVTVLLIAFTAVPVAILRREFNFRVLSLRAIAGVIVGGTVGIGMALSGWGVWSFVGQWIAMISTNVVMAWTAVDWRPGLKTTRGHMHRAGHFGAQVLGLRMAELAVVQMPTLLIGATLGPLATGLYSLCWRLVETLTFLISTPLRMVSQPAFAAVTREGGRAGDLLLDIARMTGVVAFPFFVGLAVVAEPILRLFFGEEWLGAAPVLSVMAFLGLYFS
ncbi:MAG: oligosaccharide flippase family protein, partial [Albidovulum sp.]